MGPFQGQNRIIKEIVNLIYMWGVNLSVVNCTVQSTYSTLLYELQPCKNTVVAKLTKHVFMYCTNSRICRQGQLLGLHRMPFMNSHHALDNGSTWAYLEWTAWIPTTWEDLFLSLPRMYCMNLLPRGERQHLSLPKMNCVNSYDAGKSRTLAYLECTVQYELPPRGKICTWAYLECTVWAPTTWEELYLNLPRMNCMNSHHVGKAALRHVCWAESGAPKLFLCEKSYYYVLK